MSITSRSAFSLALIIAALATLIAPASARQAKESKEPTGQISGQITINGKPAAGVFVALLATDGYMPPKSVAKATTDEQGRYLIARVAAGRYRVQALAPAYVATTESVYGTLAKSISLDDGESIDSVNISLVRGGVITGRVTDSSGRPLIREQITLKKVNERGQKDWFSPYTGEMMVTDDRGVYRVYGLPAGRYVVSAGRGMNESVMMVGGGSYYPLTYHPQATDESRAEVVEVTEGGEATGVDIVMGRVAKTYRAAGRIVDAETNKPLAGLQYGFATLQPDGKNAGMLGSNGALSGERGEFLLEGLSPGRYAAMLWSAADSDLYGDPALFEIADSDVTGLEIRVHRGASISGKVVIEGLGEQEAARKLSTLRLGTYGPPDQGVRGPGRPVQVQPDGSFEMKGLQPGSVSIQPMIYPPIKGLTLVRTERDGGEVHGGIQLAAGEHITGVTVVFAYGTGVIKIEVRLEDGPLPEGSQVMIMNQRVGQTAPSISRSQEDARGRFFFDGLAPGQYELTVHNAIMLPGGQFIRVQPAKQTVTVSNDEEAKVTFVLKRADN